MSQSALVAVSVSTLVILTVAIGAMGLRISRTTGDFMVASRAISPRANASAISGEYLSAASFLGVAGLVLVGGVHMLWFPIGYTAGYLALLCLVAAPLRRSGAYTLPDFAQWRLGSARVRRVCALLVVGVGWLYLLPQMQGAGLALRSVGGTPAYVGSLAVAGVVLLSVLAGGMRSVTLVQVFQYWLKLFAISVPIVLMAALWWQSSPRESIDSQPPVATAPVQAVTTDPVRLTTAEVTRIQVDGVLDGREVSGLIELRPGHTVTVAAGTSLRVPPGQPIPTAEQLRGARSLDPSGSTATSLYRTYSLLLALLLGTMGLPHVLVRFYTNPDGRAARRTAATVIGLLGLFYLFPPLYGALGRLYTPHLLLTGRVDAVVLELPRYLLPHPWSELSVALLVAGAFAAFLATSSGVVVTVAGVLAQDLWWSPGRTAWGRPLQPRPARHRDGVSRFRISALFAVTVPLALSFVATPTSLAGTIGLVFAVAASTFSPLLLLGIWWRGLTATGAIAGLCVGGAISIGALTATVLPLGLNPTAAMLLAQPAAWAVPTTFATMVLASRLSRSQRVEAGAVMARLHTPERISGAHRPTQ
ncbi:MAG: cation acetate symporter [Actinomycetales bacterium]